MRGRIGGIIGFASQPSAGSASRIWSLAEVYSAIRGAYYTDPYGYGGTPWPTRVFTITWPGGADYADATHTGEATFSPEVRTASSSQPYDYYWERSADDGATWNAVTGSSGSGTTEFDYNSYSGYVGSAPLTVTGQTIANDEDLYRLAVTSGLKTFYSTPATLRFDSVAISFGYDLWIWVDNVRQQNATLPAGEMVYVVWTGSATGQKYNGSYPFTLVQWEVSTDGGSTWTNGPSLQEFGGGYSDLQFTAAAGDSGKKWRVTLSHKSVSLTSRVVTLTVT